MRSLQRRLPELAVQARRRMHPQRLVLEVHLLYLLLRLLLPHALRRVAVAIVIAMTANTKVIVQLKVAAATLAPSAVAASCPTRLTRNLSLRAMTMLLAVMLPNLLRPLRVRMQGRRQWAGALPCLLQAKQAQMALAPTVSLWTPCCRWRLAWRGCPCPGCLIGIEPHLRQGLGQEHQRLLRRS